MRTSLLSLLVLAGCVQAPAGPAPDASTEAPSDAVADTSSDLDRAWYLTEFGDATAELHNGASRTLRFDPDAGRYALTLDCARFEGPTLPAAAGLGFSPPAPAAGACRLEPLEQQILNAVEASHVLSNGADSLVVGGPTARLVFQSAPGPWDDARARGVTVRGVGQEPGWWVEVTQGGPLLYVGDYGETRVAAEAPTSLPQPRSEGSVQVFDYPAAGPGVRVEVTPDVCVDAMNGAAFPATVRVTVGADTLSGCGRVLL